MTPEAIPEPEDKPNPLAEAEARMREIQRIGGEIAQVRAEIEADRAEPVEMDEETKEDLREHKEAWDEMTTEEKAECLRGLRAALEENREEIAACLPQADVELAITRLRANAERMTRLERLEDELTELILQAHADHADVKSRLAVSMADMMRAIENLTEEDWEVIPPGNRGGMMDLLNEWNGGQKEEILGQLPIELRRRYE